MSSPTSRRGRGEASGLENVVDSAMPIVTVVLSSRVRQIVER